MSLGPNFCPSADDDGGLSANPIHRYGEWTMGAYVLDTFGRPDQDSIKVLGNTLVSVAFFGDETQPDSGLLSAEAPTTDDEVQPLRERIVALYDAVTQSPKDQDVSAENVDIATEPSAQPSRTQHRRMRQWTRHLPAQAERKEALPKFTVRSSTEADIADIARVDIEAFGKVYGGEGYESKSYEELFAEKYELFKKRHEMVGGNLMPVLLRNGKIVGVVTSCPTNKQPEDFTSWEKATDNGDLSSTYDPNGRNAYVVSLSVLPEGSEAKDMLLLHQMGEFLKAGFDRAFFESRVPQFRNWVSERAQQTQRGITSYSKEELDVLANEYFGLRLERKVNKPAPYDPLLRVFGINHADRSVEKKVPFDPLLRLYERIGCKLIKILPDAYQDEESMNYGVMCVYDGEGLFNGTDLPFRIPRNKVTRQILGRALGLASKSQKLTEKVF